MKKICISIFLLFVLLLIWINMIAYTNMYANSDFQEFETFINLNNTIKIEASHKTKYDSNTKNITSHTYIKQIIDYLYLNLLADMQNNDNLPNESPEFTLTFIDSNEKEQHIMFYSAGYVVDVDNKKKYKIKNNEFTCEFAEYLGIY